MAGYSHITTAKPAWVYPMCLVFAANALFMSTSWSALWEAVLQRATPSRGCVTHTDIWAWPISSRSFDHGFATKRATILDILSERHCNGCMFSTDFFHMKHKWYVVWELSWFSIVFCVAIFSFLLFLLLFGNNLLFATRVTMCFLPWLYSSLSASVVLQSMSEEDKASRIVVAVVTLGLLLRQMTAIAFLHFNLGAVGRAIPPCSQRASIMARVLHLVILLAQRAAMWKSSHNSERSRVDNCLWLKFMPSQVVPSVGIYEKLPDGGHHIALPAIGLEVAVAAWVLHGQLGEQKAGGLLRPSVVLH